MESGSNFISYLQLSDFELKFEVLEDVNEEAYPDFCPSTQGCVTVSKSAYNLMRGEYIYSSGIPDS